MARQDDNAAVTGTTANGYDFTLEAQTEFETICDAVCARLRDDSLPPEEAYWWTRILFQEAVARLAVLAVLNAREIRDPYSVELEADEAHAA